MDAPVSSEINPEPTVIARRDEEASLEATIRHRKQLLYSLPPPLPYSPSSTIFKRHLDVLSSSLTTNPDTSWAIYKAIHPDLQVSVPDHLFSALLEHQLSEEPEDQIDRVKELLLFARQCGMEWTGFKPTSLQATFMLFSEAERSDPTVASITDELWSASLAMVKGRVGRLPTAMSFNMLERLFYRPSDTDSLSTRATSDELSPEEADHGVTDKEASSIAEVSEEGVALKRNQNRAAQVAKSREFAIWLLENKAVHLSLAFSNLWWKVLREYWDTVVLAHPGVNMVNDLIFGINRGIMINDNYLERFFSGQLDDWRLRWMRQYRPSSLEATAEVSETALSSKTYERVLVKATEGFLDSVVMPVIQTLQANGKEAKGERLLQRSKDVIARSLRHVESLVELERLLEDPNTPTPTILKQMYRAYVAVDLLAKMEVDPTAYINTIERAFIQCSSDELRDISDLAHRLLGGIHKHQQYFLRQESVFAPFLMRIATNLLETGRLPTLKGETKFWLLHLLSTCSQSQSEPVYLMVRKIYDIFRSDDFVWTADMEDVWSWLFRRAMDGSHLGKTRHLSFAARKYSDKLADGLMIKREDALEYIKTIASTNFSGRLVLLQRHLSDDRFFLGDVSKADLMEAMVEGVVSTGMARDGRLAWDWYKRFREVGDLPSYKTLRMILDVLVKSSWRINFNIRIEIIQYLSTFSHIDPELYSDHCEMIFIGLSNPDRILHEPPKDVDSVRRKHTPEEALAVAYALYQKATEFGFPSGSRYLTTALQRCLIHTRQISSAKQMANVMMGNGVTPSRHAISNLYIALAMSERPEEAEDLLDTWLASLRRTEKDAFGYTIANEYTLQHGLPEARQCVARLRGLTVDLEGIPEEGVRRYEELYRRAKATHDLVRRTRRPERPIKPSKRKASKEDEEEETEYLSDREALSMVQGE